jgi:glycosyltransferase involved in cell wall biosynthesis
MKKPLINLTLPVHNEAGVLRENVGRVREFLNTLSDWEFELVIAENGSTDQTWAITRELQKELGVRALHLTQPGRGGTLKLAWLESKADILSYMDIDLSTDLGAFPALITPLILGEYDLAIGSRLLGNSVVRRSWKREVISRVYNHLVRRILHARFTDAQCGFKAMSRYAASRLLPQVQDNHWFMDTELLIQAQRQEMRILEIPVKWHENPDSRVKLIPTIIEDIKGILRLRKEDNSR